MPLPDRPSKILLVQVWTLSSSPIPRLGLSVFFLSFRSNCAGVFPCSLPPPPPAAGPVIAQGRGLASAGERLFQRPVGQSMSRETFSLRIRHNER